MKDQRLVFSHFYIFLFLINSISFAQVKTLSGKILDKSEIDRFLEKQMDSSNVKGMSIAVINNGKVVYYRTLGITNVYTLEKVNSKTLFEAASIGKPLFAFFVMRMVDKKVLALDTPLYKYYPYPDIAYDGRYKLITARMVLDHTCGFPNWRQKDSLKILFTPGTKWSYSGEGYQYLAKVIAHLTGHTMKNADSVFQEEVAIPLKFRHSRFVLDQYIAKNLAAAHDGDNIVYVSDDKLSFHPAGGLYSEASDYSKFLMAMMNNKLLSRESQDEMLREQVQLPADNDRRTESGITGWCLGFSRKPSPYGVLYIHGGSNLGYSSSTMFNREKKFGYVFFTNSDQRSALKRNVLAFFER